MFKRKEKMTITMTVVPEGLSLVINGKLKRGNVPLAIRGLLRTAKDLTRDADLNPEDVFDPNTVRAARKGMAAAGISCDCDDCRALRGMDHPEPTDEEVAANLEQLLGSRWGKGSTR